MADASRRISFERKNYEEDFRSTYSEEEVGQLFAKSGPLAQYPDLYDFYRKHPVGFGKLFEPGEKLENATKLKEIFEKYPDEFINVFKKGGRLEKDEEASKLHAKNPKAYAYAYGMQEEIAGDEQYQDAVKTKITTNEKDEVTLAVEILRPSSFTFNITDGHVDLSSNKLSPEQMKEFINFFYSRGVSNFILPKDMEPELKQTFDKAHQEVVAKPRNVLMGAPANEVVNEVNDENSFAPEQNNPNGSNAPLNNNNSNIGGAASDITATELGRAPEVKDTVAKKSTEKKADKPVIDQVDEALKSYMHRSGKVKDATYVRSHLPDGGISYRLYGKEGAIKDDGREKDGVPQHTYDVEIRARVKNGKLVVGFGTPFGKKLDDGVAAEMVSMMKGRGNTHIRFGKNITDDDKKALREACAKAGVVPVGILPNEHHVKRMLELAQGTLSDADLQKYKLRLAKQLRKEIAEKGEDLATHRLATTITNLEGTVKYDKFNGFAADILKHIERTKQGMERKDDGTYVKSPNPADAVKIIAAGAAYAEMIDEYAAGAHGYEGLLPARKEELMRIYLAKTQEKQKEVAEDIKLQGPLNNEASKAVNAVKMATQEAIIRATQDVQEACGAKIRTVNLSGGIYDESVYGALTLRGRNTNNSNSNGNNNNNNFPPRRGGRS